MTTPKFNGREEYIAWRAEWKRQYKELSEDIRNNKTCWREQQRVSGKLPQDKWRMPIWPDNVTLLELLPERHRTVYAAMEKKYTDKWGYCPLRMLFKAKPEATKMLETLKLAKIEAQRQYLAEHPEAVKAS